MSDKERLKQIIDNAKGLTDDEGYFIDIIQLDVDDYAFLIQQAEKVEQLENSIDLLRELYKNNFELVERYEEALKEILEVLYEDNSEDKVHEITRRTLENSDESN